MMMRLRVFGRERKKNVADCAGLANDNDEVSETNTDDQNIEEEKSYQKVLERIGLACNGFHGKTVHFPILFFFFTEK